MVLESRAGRIAAPVAILIALFSVPLVRQNALRLLLPPGYDDSGFVTIDRDTLHNDGGLGTVRPYVMELWRTKAKCFRALYVMEHWTSPDGLRVERISPGTMESTGVAPWRGRLPHPAADREILVSYGWAHGDATWVGRSVLVGYTAYQITGIMPERFQLLSREVAFWLPLGPNAKHLEFIAHLAPGYTPESAQAELRKLSAAAHHWGTRKLEVITLRRNRQEDFALAFTVFEWNLLFVLVIAARGWLRFVRAGRREIAAGQQLRFLGFLVGKTAVVLLPVIPIWILFVDPTVQQYLTGLAGWAEPIFFWLYLLASAGLTIWSLNDQQNRCRICMDHLRMPVGRGSWSSLVLDRPATEFICFYGHGTLYIPGTYLLNLDSVNWTANREIWQALSS